MNKLNAEEKEILKAFESGKLKQAKNANEERAMHKAVAKATFKKDARINIRLSLRDLRALQARALKEELPYQSLVSSMLHKFVDGQLIEKAASK